SGPVLAGWALGIAAAGFRFYLRFRHDVAFTGSRQIWPQLEHRYTVMGTGELRGNTSVSRDSHFGHGGPIRGSDTCLPLRGRAESYRTSTIAINRAADLWCRPETKCAGELLGKAGGGGLPGSHDDAAGHAPT